MNRHLSLVSLVVADYDEAISFFTGALNFELCEDTPLGGGKRWVVVRPRGGAGSGVLLARAEGGSSCSSKRMTSLAIMRAWLQPACGSFGSRGMSLTASSRSSRISAATA